jgi:hypothetical protein
MEEQEFVAQRAQTKTLDALNVAAATIMVNEEWLVNEIVDKLGAPDTTHAKALIKMAGAMLAILHHEIEQTALADVKDGNLKFDEMNRKVQ